MIVCHCRAVSDQELRREVASGACSLDALAARCEVGVRCGGCLPALEQLLDHLTLPRPGPAGLVQVLSHA